MEKKAAEKSAFAKFDHVGVVVKDLEKAIEKLSSLGPGIGPFEPGKWSPITERTFRGKPTVGKVKVKIGRMGSVLVELIEPVEGDSLPKEFLESKGEGLQHLGFLVDDVEKEAAELTRRGFKILQTGKRATGGHVFMEVCGLVFELSQR